jgi:hypothetical protein
MPWSAGVLEETLVPSAARTTGGTAVSGESYGTIEDVKAQLEVTAASGTTPNLTAFLETSADDGTNWDVVGTFAAKTAAGREVITVNNFIGDNLRVRWVITGTTPSFTFSVKIVAEGN